MAIVLKYFKAAGRAEGVRIALHHAGVAFTDDRMDFATWKGIKESTPGKALPTLTVGNTTYTQSIAMLRWAGKKSDLYPKDDLKAFRCDEVMDLCQDVSRGPGHSLPPLHDQSRRL